MKKKNLFNRDGNSVWLEEIREGWWNLRLGDPKLFSYTRLLFEDEGQGIFAVDPPGGPFLSVGQEIEGVGKIVEIKNTDLGIFISVKVLKVECSVRKELGVRSIWFVIKVEDDSYLFETIWVHSKKRINLKRKFLGRVNNVMGVLKSYELSYFDLGMIAQKELKRLEFKITREELLRTLGSEPKTLELIERL